MTAWFNMNIPFYSNSNVSARSHCFRMASSQILGLSVLRSTWRDWLNSLYSWTHQSSVSCQLVNVPKLPTKSSFEDPPATNQMDVGNNGVSKSTDKYSDKEHIISQLAKYPHGAHLRGETLPERTLPDLYILFML